MSATTVVIKIDDLEYAATITKGADGQWRLWWTDHVANEWTETYTDLAVALARLATLHHGVMAGRFFFGLTDGVFPSEATDWLNSMTTE
jgi:hypothetical protein